MTYWFNDSGAFGVKRGAIMTLSSVVWKGPVIVSGWWAPSVSGFPMTIVVFAAVPRSLSSGISNSLLAGWGEGWWGAGDFLSPPTPPPGFLPAVSSGIQEPSQRWESLMSLSMFLCVPQTAVQRKRWRAPCKLMCPLPPRGFHFAMQPYGPAPPLSNPSPVSASNPGGPHFCVSSFSLSLIFLFSLRFFFFIICCTHTYFSSSFGVVCVPADSPFVFLPHSFSILKVCFLTLTEVSETKLLIGTVICTPPW